METRYTDEYKRICRLVSAIDKRIAIFENIEGNLSFPKKIQELLEIDDDRMKEFASDFEQFKSYFLEITSEVPSLCEEGYHGVGMIDDNERYLIIHVFMEGNAVYGFVVDKTSEVNRRLNVSKEMENIRHQAETDPLTGLANRKGFEVIVKSYMEKHANQGELVIMDMDNFKLVNDMLGHPVGDKVLKQFASILTDYFSEEKGIVGRIGGDEFVVFLYETIPSEELGKLLGGLIEKVKTTFAGEYPEQKLSSSIGAAYVEVGTTEYASLYKSADSALYHVKRNGKGNYSINGGTAE